MLRQRFRILISALLLAGAFALSGKNLRHGRGVAVPQFQRSLRVQYQRQILRGQIHIVVGLEHELQEVVHVEMHACAAQRRRAHIAELAVGIVFKRNNSLVVQVCAAIEIYAVERSGKALRVHLTAQGDLA